MRRRQTYQPERNNQNRDPSGAQDSHLLHVTDTLAGTRLIETMYGEHTLSIRTRFILLTADTSCVDLTLSL